MKRLCVLLLLFIAVSTSAQVNQQLLAQEDTANYPYWIAMMQDQNANYYSTVSAFEKYWANRPIAKSSGYKVFKRWQYRMEHHIFADGTRMPEGYEANIIATNAANASSQQKLLVANWTELGPFGFPVNSTGQPNGIGRINEIAFHPTDPNTIYAGTPAGGFWFTNNHGTTWTTTTDVLSTLGISAIIVNKINPNTIYLGTGDRDAGDAPGLGVYRSTNAGLTWTSYSTGLGQRTVNKMVIHPADTNILLAATNGGIFRTTNAGLSWTLVSSNATYKDIVFKPDDPNVVYATENGKFYKSINNGVSWTQSGGITGTRMAIAVTIANPNMVYVVATSGSVYGALYKSSNNGTSFTTMSTSPNIMDYSCNGSGNSGQGWYNLDIVASPTDSNTIFVGGVNIFKSTNKGSTWTISGHWTGSCGASPVHADQHVLEFNPINNRLYSGNDGGVSFSTNAGGSWADISGNMAIAQVYKIGQSVNTKNLVINGYQDNGTAVLDGTNWRTEIGGDGMECIIDYSNDNYMYGALYYGDIRRSTNRGSTFSTLADNGIRGITESGAWVTPYTLHKTDPNTMFIGYKNIWRSNNIKSSSISNVTFTQISSLGATNMRSIDHSEANIDLFYAVRSDNKLYRSDNINAVSPTWIDLSTNLPGSGTIYDIASHPINQNILYLVRGSQVFQSSNKGITWVNISNGLPGTTVNCITYQKNSADILYVGTNSGVFVKDGTTNFVNYSSGLPAYIEITELEIYYDLINAASSKIRACSYGRGLWESDLLSVNSALSIYCPTSQTLSCDPGFCVANLTNLAPTIGNATLNYTLTNNQNSSASANGSYPVGGHNVTYYLTDNGITATCSFSITVEDTESPQINCSALGTTATTYTYVGGNLNIPASGTGSTTTPAVVATINVVDTGILSSIQVLNMEGTHTYTGDLNFDLVSPAGTRVNLMANVGSSFNDFDINFSDGATTAVANVNNASPVGQNGTYIPQEPLSRFTGEEINGNWRLEIFDQYNGDVGVFNTYQLQMTYAAPLNLTGTTSPSAISCRDVFNYAVPAVADNCPSVFTQLSQGKAPGSIFNVGTTQVTLTATDASGNTSICNFSVTLADATPPVIVCPASQTISLPAGQAVTTVAYTTPTANDNCGWANVAFVSGIASGQTNVAAGSYTTSFMSTDQVGNTAMCAFNINVVNSTPQPVSISGYTQTENFVSLGAVDYNLTTSMGVNQTLTSGAGANYSFNINSGSNNTVTPVKLTDISPTRGITTLDILLIQSHILNPSGTALTTPYKLIAADVNGNNTITSLDIILIRSLLLGSASNYGNNRLWEFVPVSHVFTNPLSPWGYPKTLTFINVTANINNANFVAMKLGDVNNSWVAGQNLRMSYNNYLNLNYKTIPLYDNFYKLEVTSDNFNNILGMQGTLSWDNTKIIVSSVEAGLIYPYTNEQEMKNGKMPFTWNAEDNAPFNIDEEGVLFTLYFESKDVENEHSFQLDLSNMLNEGYDGNFNTMGLSLIQLPQINQKTQGLNLEALPNPFNSNTTLMFNLQIEEEVIISIYNTENKLLVSKQIDGKKGINTVSWYPNFDLPHGIYHCQVKTKTNGENIKLVFIQN